MTTQIMEYLVCVECGIQKNEKDMKLFDDKNYCQECYSEYIYTCGVCGNIYDCRENVRTTHNHCDYCENCREAHLRPCGGCDEYVDISSNTYSDGGRNYYHQDCFYEYYFYCEECGEVTSNDEGYYHDRRELRYCEYCWNDLGLTNNEENRSPEFSPQRINIHDTTHKHLRNKRCFGIELEVNDNNIDYSDIERHTCFGSKYDGSLNCGSEFYSPILCGDKGYIAIKDFCKSIGNAHVGTCTGYHLHIDARDLDWRSIKKIWAIYNIMEGVLFAIQPQSRQHNTYCKKSNNTLKNILSIKNKTDLTEEWYAQSDNGDRFEHYHPTKYYALNLHSYYYQSTIEIRHHSGTNSFEKIINWIKINQAIVEYALRNPISNIINLEDYGQCKTNYGIIRKLFKEVVRNETLWKYYKKRFKRFSIGQVKYGYYFSEPQKENNKEDNDNMVNLGNGYTFAVPNNEYLNHVTGAFITPEQTESDRVEIPNVLGCGDCSHLRATDNTCEIVVCTSHPHYNSNERS